MPNIRYDRINEEVKKTISEIVREMKDPRISPMTTISSAEVTNDQKIAKVKVSVYDEDDAVRKGTVDALNRAAGSYGMKPGPKDGLRRCRSSSSRWTHR